MEYLVSVTIGYLFGSIPTAYLLLKKTKGIDVSKSGSGNIGAYNSYTVSNSKLVGLMVLLIDMAKGAAAVSLTVYFYGDVFIYPAMASIFAILAHCYNPWLEFKGGRGLATFAGSTIIIFPYLLLVWIILWLVFYLIRKNIHFANISATVMSLLILFSKPDIAIKYAYPHPGSQAVLLFYAVTGLIIIFIKHIDPLMELIKNREIFKRK